MVICKNLERSNKVVTVCCYIMTGNYSEVFSIERETGVIRTNRQLVSVVKSCSDRKATDVHVAWCSVTLSR